MLPEEFYESPGLVCFKFCAVWSFCGTQVLFRFLLTTNDTNVRRRFNEYAQLILVGVFTTVPAVLLLGSLLSNFIPLTFIKLYESTGFREWFLSTFSSHPNMVLFSFGYHLFSCLFWIDFSPQDPDYYLRRGWYALHSFIFSLNICFYF